jgi:uncharacterized protein (TIGR00369 family)
MAKRAEALLWTAEQTMEWLAVEFPQAFRHGRSYVVEDLRPGHARVRAVIDETHLRPGGTVMGPAMMELADITAYILLLAHHGDAARLSVTTNLNISFLRKPLPGDIACEVDILKHGKTLIVTSARILSSANDALISHAELTYFNATGES